MRRLLADHMVTPDGVVGKAAVTVGDGRIVSVGVLASDTPTGPEIERVSGWLVPGFVDTHVHGGGGHDYATEDANEALAARAFHASHGSTTSLASLVTAPLAVLLRQIAVLADLCVDGHFAGIHLEGPFLSPGNRVPTTPRCCDRSSPPSWTG